MEFIARVTGIRADVAKQELTLTFKVRLDEESLSSAKQLAPFTGEDAGDIELSISPRQMVLLQKAQITTNVRPEEG